MGIWFALRKWETHCTIYKKGRQLHDNGSDCFLMLVMVLRKLFESQTGSRVTRCDICRSRASASSCALSSHKATIYSLIYLLVALGPDRLSSTKLQTVTGYHLTLARISWQSVWYIRNVGYMQEQNTSSQPSCCTLLFPSINYVQRQNSAIGHSRKCANTVAGGSLVLERRSPVGIATMVDHNLDIPRPVAVEGDAELG